MMKLLIDAGNSRLKWCCYADGELSQQQALEYKSDAADIVLGRLLKSVFDSDNKKVECIVAVHVLGDVFETQLKKMCEKYRCLLHLLKSKKQQYGVTLAYSNAEQFGADRYAGLLAARRCYPNSSVIIIDCGTAITLDAIDKKGVHWGGLILPGLQLWVDSLIKGTKQLQENNFDKLSLFANSTQQGIGSGCLYGLSSAIDGLIIKMQAEMGCTTVNVLCGGSAFLIQPLLQTEVQRQDDFVMQGLIKITSE